MKFGSFLDPLIFVFPFLFFRASAIAEDNTGLNIQDVPAYQGTLRAPCGGIEGLNKVPVCQAVPSIDFKGRKCAMNLMLETGESVEPWYEGKNLRTSDCFLSRTAKGQLARQIDKEVSITGSLEKARVCRLLRKCIEPECSTCKDEKILIPVSIAEAQSETETR